MTVKNIVATATLRQALTLDEIERKCGGVLCHRVRAFGSVNIQVEKHSLMQIFSNKRLIITGGLTEGQAKRIFIKYLRILVDLGIDAEYGNYRIQNIIACYIHGKALNLAKLATLNKLEFEPELFPAVRFRDNSLRVTVNIFHTGSCVILGAKSVESISIILQNIKQIIQDAES